MGNFSKMISSLILLDLTQLCLALNGLAGPTKTQSRFLLKVDLLPKLNLNSNLLKLRKKKKRLYLNTKLKLLTLTKESHTLRLKLSRKTQELRNYKDKHPQVYTLNKHSKK